MPTLVEHKRALEEAGKHMTEKEKAEIFWANVGHEVLGKGRELKGKTAQLLANLGIKAEYEDHTRVDSDSEGDEEEGEEDEGSRSGSRGLTGNPLHKTVQFADEEAALPARRSSHREAAGTCTPAEEIEAFYRLHNPAKLNDLEGILARYKGKEKELLDKLHRQYNVKG